MTAGALTEIEGLMVGAKEVGGTRLVIVGLVAGATGSGEENTGF